MNQEKPEYGNWLQPLRDFLVLEKKKEKRGPKIGRRKNAESAEKRREERGDISKYLCGRCGPVVNPCFREGEENAEEKEKKKTQRRRKNAENAENAEKRGEEREKKKERRGAKIGRREKR